MIRTQAFLLNAIYGLRHDISNSNGYHDPLLHDLQYIHDLFIGGEGKGETGDFMKRDAYFCVDLPKRRL